MNLIVTKLPDDTLALTNCVYVSPLQQETWDMYLIIQNSCYKCTAHPEINLGHIGLNRVLRNKYTLSLNDEIIVFQQYISPIINNTTPTNVKMSITRIVKGKNMVYISEKDILNRIQSVFKDYYIINGQYLILEFEGNNYVINISTDESGFINDQTNIELSTNDENIAFLGSTLLKKDLFKDDYDFTQLGIGGLNTELLVIFRRALASRAIKNETIQKLGIKHVKGILLHGPPGTGKTLIGKNIAKLISDNPPKIINGPDILNKYVGESEKNVRDLFETAREEYRKMGDNSQIHVFIFDEIDAICKKRGSGSQAGVTDSVVNQILTILEGPESINNILIIAMTNRIDLLDPALLRPGRLEIHVPVGLADSAGRNDILKIHTQKMTSNHMISTDIDVNNIISNTNNFSGAEMEALVKSAVSHALHRNIINEQDNQDILVCNNDFLQALQDVKPIFGNCCNELKAILPDNLILNNFQQEAYNKILKLFSIKSRKSTVLVKGGKDSGKTLLSSLIARDVGTGYVKYIKPFDAPINETLRAQFLLDLFKDAYIVDDSLIILDDVEILVNFANINGRISFSNTMFQMLLTVIKTLPTKISSKIKIVVTCGESELWESISKYFDANLVL